jgi:hypothetical protein
MSSKAKTIARRLLKQNRGTQSITARSWRVIAREDYQDRIPNGTLSRFALADGEWLPKDEYQYLLGLKHQRKCRHVQPRDLFDMTQSALLAALNNRKEMPPLDPRIVREFKKLGWMKHQRAGAR